MKSIKNALPYVLLVSFSALTHFKQPEIADSIITIALCALCGFKIFLESKETPNYTEVFKEEMQKRDQAIKDLQTTVGIYAVSQKKKQQVDNVRW